VHRAFDFRRDCPRLSQYAPTIPLGATADVGAEAPGRVHEQIRGYSVLVVRCSVTVRMAPIVEVAVNMALLSLV
jgi:hypothetical protein